MQEAGIRVPKGKNYSCSDEAKCSFHAFRGMAVVIKPKLTNFGLGITILKENLDIESYKWAVDYAFKYDKSILIEEFIPGDEYRFFVLEDKVLGILNRVPANIVGDGKSTIEELVTEKNKDSLRGKGYKTPLEKINLGEAESLFLKEQGLSFCSVPAEGKKVFLRENSNISTGGDSIDLTDDVHSSYKDLAVKAMKALNVKVTGLDMMISNIKEPADSTNYGIIELNFNPAIHIHCHPYKGKNRKLNEALLDFLGFEI